MPAKCTYEANPQQLTDIFAGKTPAAVVNIVNSNPGTNWIVSDLGGWVTGVSAALKSSNISGVQIGGLTAGKANIQGVKDGTESAWTGYSLPIVGYSVVDSMARHSVGQAVRDERPAHADPHQAERQDAGAHPRG